jgi:predicted ester cyclase
MIKSFTSALIRDSWAAKFKTGDVDTLMATMVEHPCVNYIPTLTGGTDQKNLRRFYDEYFLPDTPPSFKMKLISRTIGADQIVDEIVVSFNHTKEISWMLPGIPATKKHVEIAMVVVVCVRGGKIHHENTYWDQASILAQIGLLDPKLIPPRMKKLDINRLPVSGAASAEKVLDKNSQPSNNMMDDW